MKYNSKCGLYLLTLGIALCCLINEGSCRQKYTSRDGVPWPPPPTNMRPIIGVLAQEVNPKSPDIKHGDTYMMAAYVQYLQMAGARVVPIRVGEPNGYYENIFSQINGFLIPGGGVNISSSLYGKAAEIMLKLAIKATAADDYFPVWGTCLGFEALVDIIAGERILETCDAENYPLPLNLASGWGSSVMFRGMPSVLREGAAVYNITPNFHVKCLTPEKFKATQRLWEVFHILATNKDRKGKVFISMIEGIPRKFLPLYGSQWHPEKVSFIWDESKNINHSLLAVRLQQYMANFFVNDARRNTHRFKDITTEGAAIIQNYQPVYSGAPSFSLNYYFNLTTSVKQKLLCNLATELKSYLCGK